MTTPLIHKQLLAQLGVALSYPDARWRSGLEALEPLAAAHGSSLDAVERFIAEQGPVDLDALAEIYTRTFDVAPSCIPYLSIHLFGEESFRRASLMSGLNESLTKAGVDLGNELPDHLAVVLRAAPALPAELWEDLLEFVMRAAVHAMVEAFTESNNPYRWLLRAVQDVVGPATEEDLERLAIARREYASLKRAAAAKTGAACGGS